MKRGLKALALVAVVWMACAAAGCKTGKGCDCPTFGKNETPEVKRF